MYGLSRFVFPRVILHMRVGVPHNASQHFRFIESLAVVQYRPQALAAKAHRSSDCAGCP